MDSKAFANKEIPNLEKTIKTLTTLINIVINVMISNLSILDIKLKKECTHTILEKDFSVVATFSQVYFTLCNGHKLFKIYSRRVSEYDEDHKTFRDAAYEGEKYMNFARAYLKAHIKLLQEQTIGNTNTHKIYRG